MRYFILLTTCVLSIDLIATSTDLAESSDVVKTTDTPVEVQEEPPVGADDYQDTISPKTEGTSPSVEAADASASASVEETAQVASDENSEATESTVDEDESQLFEFDEPIPLAERRPNLGQKQLGVDIHYGLVGSGPTRLINDVHYGLFDWWTIRTSFTLLPLSLINRFQIGELEEASGVWLIEAGLESYDGGSTNPDLEEPIGWKLGLEGSVGHARKIGENKQLYTMLHYRELLTQFSQDKQRVFGFDASVMFSLNKALGATVGLSFVEVLGTDFVQRTIDFVEIGRPGFSYYMVRDEGLARSLSLPMSLTYGLLNTFDVDVFVTPRVFPRLDIVFGAGFKWRFDFSKS